MKGQHSSKVRILARQTVSVIVSYLSKHSSMSCMRKMRTPLSSMLIFHDSIFERFSLASVDTCLYDHDTSSYKLTFGEVQSNAHLCGSQSYNVYLYDWCGPIR